MTEARIHTVQKAENDLVLSFLSLRRGIGLLGLFLPVALIAWSLLAPVFGQPGGLLPSFSAYYHSPMRDVFVGTMVAQAVFLWSYEGYRPLTGEWISDRVMAQAASLGALAVALSPTRGEGGCTLVGCVIGEVRAEWLHLIGAAVFFGALAVFCLVLFTRGEAEDADKRARNRIYRACGVLIVAAMVGIGVLGFTEIGAGWEAWHPVFWLEVVATLAFGTAWMVKGQSLRPLVTLMAR